MQVYHSVDWFRYTVPFGGGHTCAFDDTLPCFDRTYAEIKPIPPYTRALRLIAGRVDWNPNREDLKYCVTMTGDDLRAAAEMGTEAKTLMRQAAQRLGSATRIDLAIDVFDGGKTAADAFQWSEDGKMTYTARSTRFVQGRESGKGSGDTLYIGSRTSQRMVRIYDKGKEQKLPDADWLRIEIELKGETAAQAMKMLQTRTVTEVARMYIGGTIGIADNWWREVLGAEPAEAPPEVPRKESNTEDWIYETVLPLLERHLSAPDADGTLRDALIQMLVRTGKK